MPAAKWKAERDPLWRGDSASGVRSPSPQADPSLVRHILYLDGSGRATPYSSTTESWHIGELFAGKGGRVWKTTVSTATSAGIRHIDRRELLRLLRGGGQGEARWPRAYDVLLARRYVEEWQEHLLDFRPLDRGTRSNVADVVGKVFTRGAP